MQKTEEIFANLIQMLPSESSIQNHEGSRGVIPVVGVGGEAAHQFFFSQQNGQIHAQNLYKFQKCSYLN